MWNAEGFHAQVAKETMAKLLTAGHPITKSLANSIEEAALQRTPTYNGQGYGADAHAVLRTLGFDPDEHGNLPNLHVEDNSCPRAGHVVRITEKTWYGPAGMLMVLCGQRKDTPTFFRIASINGSFYFDGDNEKDYIDLSCGGPSSIGHYYVDRFTKTDEQHAVSFWRFFASPQAHTGVYYKRMFPVWEWDGAESDCVSYSHDGNPLPRNK